MVAMLLLRSKWSVAVAIVVSVSAGVLFCSGYTPSNSGKQSTISDTAYAGTASCRSCHQAIYDSFLATAHYRTSRPASAATIKGSFDSGKNVFSYNPFMQVRLEAEGEQHFQTVYVNGEPTHRESFDIVVGSGKKGQTFLYWKEAQLYQLPVSWFVPSQSWCNSPGYPPGMPRFNRLIPARCIECHGSGAVAETNENNVSYFDRNSIEYGISCERCHGPAAAHVNWHTQHPGDKQSKFMQSQDKWTRAQQVDLCALCHSGIRVPLKPAFSFTAGDRLEDFSRPKYNADSAAMLDVHGNQYGLMTSSKCFLNSNMTCSSCHDTHRQEAGNLAVFSARCLNCHGEGAKAVCKINPGNAFVLHENCIDCHMPLLPSKAIFLQMADPGKSTADPVRTHFVSVYPDAMKAFMKQVKRKQKHT